MHFISQNFIIVLLASLVLAEECRWNNDDEIQDYRLMPGTGYNIITGSPLAQEDQGLTPGQTFTIPDQKKILKSTKPGTACPQWAWKVPDHSDWSFMEDGSVSDAQKSEAINSAKSYQEESSTHVEETVEGITPQGLSLKFTASQDFHTKKTEFSQSNFVMVRTARYSTAFKNSVNEVKAQLHPGYMETVLRGYFSENLVDFINFYGTHFMQEITGGARLELITTFDSHDYQVVSSNSQFFKEGLEGMYEEIAAGVSAENSHHQAQSKYVRSLTKTHDLHCRGGDHCEIGDSHTVSDFWDGAYRFPAIMHAKLYPHDVFIAGKSEKDNYRWLELQQYLNEHYADLHLEHTQTLDRDRFLNMWKDALKSFCTESVSNGKLTNSCKPSDNALPANMHIDYDQHAQKLHGWGKVHDQDNYRDYYPPKDWINEEELKSQSSWLQVVKIQMRCYKKQPMMLKFFLGDHVSPPREYHVIGQEDATSECQDQNDCLSDEVTMARGYTGGCGPVWLNYCDWCCKKRDDNNMNIITKTLEGDDIISGVDVQVKQLEDGKTQVSQLLFKILKGTDPVAEPETFGCEGDAPGNSIEPVHFDWRHYRLLNYRGSTTWYGQIANLEFKLYHLEGAGDVVAWKALHSEKNDDLQRCVSRMYHTDVQIHSPNEWNGKTGHQVCQEFGYKGCDAVMDWECQLKDCSEIAGGTRAVGCLHSVGDYCTGSYQEDGRPSEGTKCTSQCYYENGYWGSSWCRVDGGNWGAECVRCGQNQSGSRRRTADLFAQQGTSALRSIKKALTAQDAAE